MVVALPFDQTRNSQPLEKSSIEAYCRLVECEVVEVAENGIQA